MAEAIALALHFYPGYTLNSLLDMYVSQFYLLLSEAQKLIAQSRLDSIQAALMPHMESQDRSKQISDIERATRDMLEVDDDQDDIENLKSLLGG